MEWRPGHVPYTCSWGTPLNIMYMCIIGFLFEMSFPSFCRSVVLSVVSSYQSMVIAYAGVGPLILRSVVEPHYDFIRQETSITHIELHVHCILLQARIPRDRTLKIWEQNILVHIVQQKREHLNSSISISYII